MGKRRYAIVAAILVIAAAIALCLAKSCSHHNDGDEAVETDTLGIIVAQARKCSRLYVAEYKLHKIVTHSDDARLKGSLLSHDFDIKLPVGRRKVAIPMDATVKAYVDMGNLSADDVYRDGEKIEIHLPNPQIAITSTSIDHDGVKQHVAWLRHDFSDEELSAYEKLGRQSIEAATKEMDIRETARRGAAQVIIPIMVKMGFKEHNVKIVFADEEQETLRNGDVEKR